MSYWAVTDFPFAVEPVAGDNVGRNRVVVVVVQLLLGMLAAATDVVALEATTVVVVAVTAAVAQRGMPRGLAAAPPFLRFLVTLVAADKFVRADVVVVDLRVEELQQEEETEVAAMKLRTLLKTEERRKVVVAAVAQIGNTGPLRYLAKTASFEWRFADLWLLLTEDLLVLLLALCLLPR